MHSYLIDTFIKRNQESPSQQFKVEYKGTEYEGWGMAKPLNYSKDYLDVNTRIGMAIEVLMGRAIAIHYTEDEIESGATPTLLLEHLGKVAEEPKKEPKDETKPTEGSEATDKGGSSSECPHETCPGEQAQ